jgi:transcription initiation factor IIE alpha subunit
MKQTLIKYFPENKEISLERKRDEEKENEEGKNRYWKTNYVTLRRSGHPGWLPQKPL